MKTSQNLFNRFPLKLSISIDIIKNSRCVSQYFFAFTHLPVDVNKHIPI